MRGNVIRTLAVAIGLALLLEGPALAHTRIEPTSTTISASKTNIEPGQSVVFNGRLRSDWSKCVATRRVRLYRWDTPFGSDTTAGNGAYRFERQITTTAKWSVRFTGRRFGTHPHVHRCLASRSRQIRVKVN